MKLAPPAAAIIGLLLFARSASASQFVVTDATYTHSASTTTDSHYKVKAAAGSPTNWRAPVDYAGQGATAHVRLEVFTKPSASATRFQICFAIAPSYACTDQSPVYTGTGVVEWDTAVPAFFQYAKVDWSKSPSEISLILKDTKNVKPSPENVGAATAALFMPTNVRITVTMVSAGDTYQPPQRSPDSADAGAVDEVDVPSGGDEPAEPDIVDPAAPAATPPSTDTASTRGRHLESTAGPACAVGRATTAFYVPLGLLLAILGAFARRTMRR